MQFLDRRAHRPGQPARTATTRGITILETMFAAAVMAFTLTTSITAMQRAFLMLDTSRNLTIGGQILQAAVEQTTMMSWTEVSQLPASAVVAIDPGFRNFPKVRDRFTLQREVKKVRGNNELLEVTYTISWVNISGPLWRSYTLYYSRYGCFDYLYNSTT